MNPIVRFVQTVGITSVPLGGFFVGGWSPATLLAVYWFENLFGSLLIAARIGLHWRLTRKRGHYQGRVDAQPRRSGYGRPGGVASRGGGFAAIDRAARAAAGRKSGATGSSAGATPRPSAPPNPTGRPVFLTSFVLVTLVFNLAHGFFLTLILVALVGMP